MNILSRSIAVVICLCAFITSSGHVATAAQEQSKRPIRLLVPSPPGGPSDFAARLIAPKLSEALGQNVVIDTRQSVNVSLYKKLPYDPLRDFTPVSRLISAGSTLVANPKIAPKSFAEIVAAAKREPGKFNIGVAGAQGQVTTGYLTSATGMRLNNVPYKGSSPTEFAVISGEVELAFLSIPVAAPHVKAGRMKAFGVSTAKRSPLMPDVPTISESGVPGFEFGNWHGLFVPAGTSERLVRRLHHEVVRIFESQEVRDLVLARGSEIIASTPEEFRAMLERDIPRYRKLMAEAGIKPQ